MSPLNAWILDNTDTLSLQVEDLQWIRNSFPGIQDMSVKIQIQGKPYEGRGHATTKDVAVQKALAEAVERAMCLQHLESTNGVAAHYDLELAKKNALNELLERDLFLSHFLTKTPFILADEWRAFLPDKVFAELERAGDSLRIYKMHPTSHGQGVVCLIRGGERWGGVLGLSFGLGDESTLVIKATLEAYRYYWHRRSRQILNDHHSLENFLALPKWKYEDNGRLGLNPEYFSRISSLFPEESLSSPRAQDLVDYRSTEFNYREFSLEEIGLKNCPLKVVHCSAPETQPLLPGPFRLEAISPGGLLRFTNGRSFIQETLPHPMD